MKNLVLAALLSVASLSAFAIEPSQSEINGVKFFCENAIKYTMIKDFAVNNPGDKQGLKDFKNFLGESPAYSCRAKKSPHQEDVSWCDGSGCTGAQATIVDGECVVGEVWSGQDDGDEIDWDWHRKNCFQK